VWKNKNDNTKKGEMKEKNKYFKILAIIALLLVYEVEV
jgi:hypothetical protein